MAHAYYNSDTILVSLARIVCDDGNAAFNETPLQNISRHEAYVLDRSYPNSHHRNGLSFAAATTTTSGTYKNALDEARKAKVMADDARISEIDFTDDHNLCKCLLS